MTTRPASAAQPPVLWTIVEPAKSVKPRSLQPAFAPGPGADEGVGECREEEGEEEEGPHLHSLGQRAGDDGGCGGDEDHLEEPVGHRGVGGLLKDARGGRATLGIEQGNLGGGRAVGEGERADELAEVQAKQGEVSAHADVHEVVADGEVGEPGDGVEADVLHADHGGVLGAYGASLKHGESGAHPHDEGAPDQEGEGVEDEGGLILDTHGVRDAGAEEHQQNGCNAGRGEDDGDAVTGHEPL